MKNLMKIIAILTTLTSMTACGAASDLAEKAGDLIDSALEATRLLVATQQIELEARNEFLTNLDPNLTLTERAAAIEAEANRRANLSEAEKTAFARDVQNRVDYLKTVEGLSQQQRDDNLRQCQRDETGEGCAIVILTFCADSPFEDFCLDREVYDVTRAPTCMKDRATGGCTVTIARICSNNPFNALCVDDNNYLSSRRTICLTETTSTRCAPTVALYCAQDVYDNVCNDTSYADNRLSIDESVDEIVSRDCANRPGDGRCETIIRFVCERQPLNPACDNRSAYRPARVTECLTGDRRNSDQLCAKTVEQVCSANSLEDLCVGVDAYASLQELACSGESATSKPECAPTLMGICGNLAGTSATGDPFGTVCSNDVFKPARDAIALACVTVTDGRLCQAEIDYVCRNTPFNDRCKGVESALPVQIRACIGQEATGNCADATFFTDATVLGCLANPFGPLCIAEGSTFAPYVSVAQDATCLNSGVLANCANPTAVFATLPTSLLAIRQDPTIPHHLSTNPYRNGFITIESTDLDENGNLMVSFGESGNFETTTTNTDSGILDHTALSLKVNAGGAIIADPSMNILANPFIPGAAVTLRRDSGASDNSDSDDGVAYFATTDANGNSDGLAYAGILPTTNLGAPLLPQPVADGADNITAIWGGHVSYRQNPNVQNRVTNFYVDFTAGTIGFANTAETDGTGVVDAPIAVGGTNLRLSGKFGDSHNGLDGLPLAPGELGGTVGFYFGVFSATNTKPNAGEFNLHGLIGQEGVVGVFLNTTTGGTLVGGFTASNPTHPNNQ